MFLLFFLINDLYFLIIAVVAQIFNPTVELKMPTGVPAKEAKAELKRYLVTVEAKMSKCSK